MLPNQGTIQFSDHSVLYDILIPKDHLLRKINGLIDFNFVYKELKDKYCPDNGRTAEDPVRMFKYLLLKTIYTLSDVDVVEHSRYDLSYKYFLGMMPEDDVINPSSLCTDEPNPGKKLGFIAQEMGREINTTGSKANHTEIQKLVVRMKDELEKIKEQSLNIL